MKYRFFIIVMSLFLGFSFSFEETQAQPSRAASKLLQKLSPKIFKSVAKSTARGIALSSLKSSSNKSAIEGGFYTFYDYYGDPHVAYAGINTSSKTITISVYATNEILNEKSLVYSVTLCEGDSFSFGPAQGWHWLSGEKMHIRFSNGDRIYWKL